MKVVDSSVYVSAFLEDDVHHAKAVELLEKISETVLVPYGIFSEVITVLTYKASPERAEAFAQYILSEDHFTLVDGNTFEEYVFWKNFPFKKISFIDISCIFLSLRYSAELLSFDEEQKKIYLKVSPT